MSRKTIEEDSNMIDRTLEELAKLILRFDKNPHKTRKEKNTIKKIQRFGVRYMIRSSMLN